MQVHIPILKLEAKHLKRTTGCSHYEALNSIATKHGFSSWSHLHAKLASEEKEAPGGEFLERLQDFVGGDYSDRNLKVFLNIWAGLGGRKGARTYSAAVSGLLDSCLVVIFAAGLFDQAERISKDRTTRPFDGTVLLKEAWEANNLMLAELGE